MFRAVNSSKEEQWRSRLQRFQTSGVSVARFCQREQVSVPSFYQWRKRLAAATAKVTSPVFVPVRLTQPTAVEIQLPNGARVRVPPGQPDALRVVIEAAGRLSGDDQTEVDAC
jgi:predicted alpha/beta hydrolase family esterase